jgi:hypothetical protein
MDALIQSLILKTPFLSAGDKSFLSEKVPMMSPLDKLKLRQSLETGVAPAILQQLQLTRAKFFDQEIPKPPDAISKVINAVLPPKPKKVISFSILSQNQLLGGPTPQAITTDKVPAINTLADFNHPAQLSQLQPKHITFNINDNGDQILQTFLKKLDTLFAGIPNLNVRRCYFMNFLQSPLFSGYLNTGLTALRHPELEPSKIILNLLYQIDSNYLNNKQFVHAATVSNHLRGLCGL